MKHREDQHRRRWPAVKVKVRVNERVINDDGEIEAHSGVHETTVGRVLVYEIVPEGISFDEVNKTMVNKDMSRLINLAIEGWAERNGHLC